MNSSLSKNERMHLTILEVDLILELILNLNFVLEDEFEKPCTTKLMELAAILNFDATLNKI